MRTVKIFLYLAYPAAEGKEFLPFAQKKRPKQTHQTKLVRIFPFLPTVVAPRRSPRSKRENANIMRKRFVS